MNTEKYWKSKVFILGWVVPMTMFLSLMLNLSWRTPMWMDEYAFYRLAGNFPEYSTHASWLYEDRPALLHSAGDWDEFDLDWAIKLTYENPIQHHTPLAVMLMSPVVKGLDWLADKGVLPHIEDTHDPMRAEPMTFILRLIPITLWVVSMWLTYLMLRKRVGTSVLTYSLPLASSAMLFMGIYLFYWDVFMMFFIILAFYIMETRPRSKWRYVVGCCLVNTKIFIGIMFLAPLVIKDVFEGSFKNWWKMPLTVLSIIPFWVTTWLVTGNPMYLVDHYLEGVPIHTFVYSLWGDFGAIVNQMWNLGVPFLIAMTFPILFYYKKYPSYTTLYFFGMLYAWASGLGITHLSTMLYLGALITPIVSYEMGWIEWIKMGLGKVRRVTQ